ncbi:MAG: potassium-transporting ATPase subunit KdpC [Bacilli bacterium]
MKQIVTIVKSSIRLTLALVVLCGLVYPFFITGVGQLVMADRADGSMIKNSNGEIIGSKLIGQSFTQPQYFQGRVSSIGYEASASGSMNYALSNEAFQQRVTESANAWALPGAIQTDLITNSGSGLDPHITVQSARLQVERIAKARNVSPTVVEDVVNKAIEGQIFGLDYVNVLEMNVALDQIALP